MKLFRVDRKTDTDYGEFDAFVCVAKDEEEARCIHPEGKCVFSNELSDWVNAHNGSINKFARYTWPDELSELTVTYLGEAVDSENKIVLASYRND